MKRGELWWANLGEDPVGSQPGYVRPVIIVQSDRLNRSKINSILAVSLTTNLANASELGNVKIYAHESGLPKDSVVIVSQIVTLDRTQFIKIIGSVPMAILLAVEDGLKIVLSL